MKLDHKYILFSTVVLIGIVFTSSILEYIYIILRFQESWDPTQNLIILILVFLGILLVGSMSYFWSLVRKNKQFNNLSDQASLGITAVLITTSLKAIWLILKI